MTTLQISILAFDGMEALGFAGPFEVFTTAARMHQRLYPDSDPWSAVCCVAQGIGPITARAGLRVLPDVSFDDLEGTIDLLLIPGGAVDEAMQSAATLRWIRQSAALAGINASICTGAFLLAASGVFRNARVTTHWEDVADLRQQFPALRVQTGVRWIDEGRVVTSAGISAGIDMSLHLVARLGGEELAVRTARQMDFAWTRN